MNNDISLPFVVLLVPMGLLLIIYEVKEIMRGRANPLAWCNGRTYRRAENPFMFWTYVVGGLLFGLLLIMYAVFFLLAR